MRTVTVSGLALSIALFVTSQAGAVQYFYDDFDDGNMDEWTQETAITGVDIFPDDPPDSALQYDWAARDAVVHGHYGSFGYGHDDYETSDAIRATRPLDETNLADTIYISWSTMHVGDYYGGGSCMGSKSIYWGLINDAGRGLGFYVAIDKGNVTGSFEVQQTSDGGETWVSAGGIELSPPPQWADNTFELQDYEVIWQRAGGPPSVTLKYEGVDMGTYMLDTTVNNEVKDPTKVVMAPHNSSVDEDVTWINALMADDIYVGDEPNPNSIPVLDKGDTNGDLYVDIQDLTALANNWRSTSRT